MTTTYKVNYWLSAYPNFDKNVQAKLIIEDFCNKRIFALNNPEFFEVLSFCSEFRTKEEIQHYIVNTFGFDADVADEMITQLCERKLLIEPQDKTYQYETMASGWKKHEWNDALDYFIAMKDYPFLDYESEDAKAVDNEMMGEYIELQPVPPIYKRYNVTAIPLEDNFKAFEEVDIRKMFVEEVFDLAAGVHTLGRSAISNIMQYTFGATGTVQFPVQGAFLLKTSPSGGARHPIEAYLVSLNTDFGPGVFHYSVEKHALEKMDVSLNQEELQELIYELKTGPQFAIKAVVIFSAIYPRSMWRYREPRSYRVVLHDLGHLLETMKIVCKASSVNTYYGHGFHDSQVEEKLGIDSSTENVLKFAAIG